MKLKTASFHVRATAAQAAAWNRAAEAEGHASVGTWAAEALDRYLDALKRAGKPLALAWHKGRFRVALEGREAEVQGQMSPPFGIYHGTPPDSARLDEVSIPGLPASRADRRDLPLRPPLQSPRFRAGAPLGALGRE